MNFESYKIIIKAFSGNLRSVKSWISCKKYVKKYLQMMIIYFIYNIYTVVSSLKDVTIAGIMNINRS